MAWERPKVTKILNVESLCKIHIAFLFACVGHLEFSIIYSVFIYIWASCFLGSITVTAALQNSPYCFCVRVDYEYVDTNHWKIGSAKLAHQLVQIQYIHVYKCDNSNIESNTKMTKLIKVNKEYTIRKGGHRLALQYVFKFVWTSLIHVLLLSLPIACNNNNSMHKIMKKKKNINDFTAEFQCTVEEWGGWFGEVELMLEMLTNQRHQFIFSSSIYMMKCALCIMVVIVVELMLCEREKTTNVIPNYTMENDSMMFLEHNVSIRTCICDA